MQKKLKTTNKQFPEQLRPFQFKKGQSGNPKGRPKGKTMKEFARDFLMSMSDEEKVKFMNSLPGDVVWKMAEGQPHQTGDITSGGKPFPILSDAVHKDESPEENQGAGKES